MPAQSPQQIASDAPSTDGAGRIKHRFLQPVIKHTHEVAPSRAPLNRKVNTMNNNQNHSCVGAEHTNNLMPTTQGDPHRSAAGEIHVVNHPDRGDVPGWVMLTLMSAVLVAGLLLIAQPALEGLFNDAISRVTGQ